MRWNETLTQMFGLFNFDSPKPNLKFPQLKAEKRTIPTDRRQNTNKQNKNKTNQINILNVKSLFGCVGAFTFSVAVNSQRMAAHIN